MLPSQDQAGVGADEMTPVVLIYGWNVAEKLGDEGESTAEERANRSFA